ncbi:MAG: hypothetical protein FJ145_04290 [Deltaproteobacteria bacterium]|nr:hypothetical protein [Deltaproteobacteria bacterium]
MRGFRIELGEIEATLARHPAIKETAAIVREDSPGDRRVVAYIAAEPAPSADELRAHARATLPDYMVPSQFVVLAALPLTPNGKIDRKALPAPNPIQRDLSTEYIGPSGEIEETMERIWKTVLRQEKVSVRDNFFDLGGHSLLAVQIYARMREEFQIDLPMVTLFRYPTIEQLARPVADAQRQRYSSSQVGTTGWQYLRQFQAGNGKSPIYMVPGGMGGEVDVELFFYARLAHYVGAEYPIFGLRPKGAEGLEAPHANVAQMARDYLAEIKEFQPNGPYYLTGACIGGVLAYEMACQLERCGDQVAFLGLLDTEFPKLSDYLYFLAEPVVERWQQATKRWAENYYVQRARYHWDEVTNLSWADLPGYFSHRGMAAFADLKTGELAQGVQQPVTVGRTQHSNDVSASIGAFKRAYIKALRKHRPRKYHGKVTLINAAELATQTNGTLGWENLARGGIEVHWLPGTHITLFRQEVKILGAKLKECLDR